MASNLIIARGGTEFIPPLSLAFWRWLFCFLILLPFTFVYLKNNFHNYKNMMADYASKSEEHAHHAQKMHNSLQLLNHAWRDNMIE